jgi:MFS family permease
MENKEALNTLNDIKEMMERSSKFKAISGLSIIIIGILASLVSAYIYFFLGDYHINTPAKWRTTIIVAFCLLVVAFLTVFFMAFLKAKRHNLRFTFDTTMRRLLLNFFTPMVAGGLLCAALLMQQHYGLVSSITLIFYGLALINSSYFSYHELRYLGYAELALGLIDCFLVDYAVLTWFLGFGVLHIVFGIIFMLKYERRK